MRAILLATTMLLLLLSGCTKKENDKPILQEVEAMKQAQVGDVVEFGNYEQDNNLENGKEDVAWIVTNIQDGKVELISEKIIDVKPFHEEFEDTTWEKSTIREWLNNEFKQDIFTNDEQLYLYEKSTINKDFEHKDGVTDGGNDTTDEIYLLDVDEVNSLSSEIIPAKATEYAKENGCFTDFGRGFWWTRSIGSSNKHFLPVNTVGSTISTGTNVNYESFGIRPSIVINISEK